MKEYIIFGSNCNYFVYFPKNTKCLTFCRLSFQVSVIFCLILPKLQPLFQQQSENQYGEKILDTIGNNSRGLLTPPPLNNTKIQKPIQGEAAYSYASKCIHIPVTTTYVRTMTAGKCYIFYYPRALKVWSKHEVVYFFVEKTFQCQ